MVQNPRTKQWSKLKKRDAQGKETEQFWTVGEVWNMIVEHAWRTGEPGVVFIDRINERNPIKNVGLIEATNPCGEQPLHPFDSCNLGSVNLGVLVKGDGANARFDWDEYRSIIHAHDALPRQRDRGQPATRCRRSTTCRRPRAASVSA